MHIIDTADNVGVLGVHLESALKKTRMILRIGLSVKVIVVRPHCYLYCPCTYGTGS